MPQLLTIVIVLGVLEVSLTIAVIVLSLVGTRRNAPNESTDT